MNKKLCKPNEAVVVEIILRLSRYIPEPTDPQFYELVNFRYKSLESLQRKIFKLAMEIELWACRAVPKYIRNQEGFPKYFASNILHQLSLLVPGNIIFYINDFLQEKPYAIACDLAEIKYRKSVNPRDMCYLYDTFSGMSPKVDRS
jgi:hypothetical protein